MKLTEAFEEITSQLPHIPSSRRYWFIRTKGGTFYQDFVKNSFVGVGFDWLPLKDVIGVKLTDKKAMKRVADAIAQKDSTQKKNKYGAIQLVKFVNYVQDGDVVIVPSRSSSKISVGIVKGDAYVGKSIRIQGVTPSTYSIRRKVEWRLVDLSRSSLDPKLYKLMYAHHAINDGTPHADRIDKLLHSIYVKNGRVHVVIRVETKEEILPGDFFGFGSGMVKLLDDYCEYEKLDYRSTDLRAKTDVQSPGFTEAIGLIAQIGVPLVLLIFAIGGSGSLKFKSNKEEGTTFEVKGSSKGIATIIDSLSNFLTARNRDANTSKMMDTFIEKLKALPPNEAVPFLNQISQGLLNRLPEGQTKKRNPDNDGGSS